MAVKVAVVAPAGTTIDAGTVKDAVVLLTSVTVEPPVGAGPDRVTVQGVVPAGARSVVPHASELKEICATNERLALLLAPLTVAVAVAV